MLIRLTIWTLAEAESSFQKAEIVMGDIVAQEAIGRRTEWTLSMKSSQI